MKLVRSAAELGPSGRKACVAIGFFDGVHLGHQQIIHQAESDAQQNDATSVVITFDPHPASVVSPSASPPLIQTRAHRLRTIGDLNPGAVLLMEFNEELRVQTGEAFVRRLYHELGGIHSVCIGADFHFGYQRTGNVALLETLGVELGFKVHGIKAVALGGQTVSSTRIREAIRRGELESVAEMLGRAYSIEGQVCRGDQLGQSLGFPTANLDVTGLVLPPKGVYAVQAQIGETWHHAVANIGTRPTVAPDGAARRLEAHLLEFDGNLYGQQVEVVFVDRLREERRFNSREALQRQIQQDVAEARRRFARCTLPGAKQT
jgi:riboflavin kinase/FMN adenylyltransferase